MTAAPDIVERLRRISCSDVGIGETALMRAVQAAGDAAAEIERLRVACAGGLTVAEGMTDECVKLSERCERLAHGQITLRQRLDATRARLADVATIVENAITLAAEINVELLQARIFRR